MIINHKMEVIFVQTPTLHFQLCYHWSDKIHTCILKYLFVKYHFIFQQFCEVDLDKLLKLKVFLYLDGYVVCNVDSRY